MGRAQRKFLELRRIVKVAKNIKHRVVVFRKVEKQKAKAKKQSRKARKMLKKVLHGHNVTLIKAAKLTVKKAKAAVKKLVKKSAKIVKKDIKHTHKNARKIKIGVHINLKCHCAPKVRKLGKKPVS